MIVPLRIDEFRLELASHFHWYNDARPHQSLSGRTPNEVYLGIPGAREGPKFQTRSGIMKSTGRRKRCYEVVATSDLALVVGYLEHRRHLPVVSLKRAA